jgi:glycosyltransferase involved in cell wall biosynthesis
MGRRTDLSLILACRNLEPRLAGSLRQIMHTLSLSHLTYELILIDDDSEDATASFIKRFAKSVRTKNPKIKTIYHHFRMGRARTVVEGIAKATGTVVGIMSPTMGISPVYIPITVDTIIQGQADVLVGRRIFHSMTKPEVHLTNFFMANVTKLLVDTSGVDVFSNFKFFNRKKIKNLVSRVKNQGMLWDTELLIHAKRQGLKIAEMPVVYRPRLPSFSISDFREETGGFISDLLELWRRLYLKSRGRI